MSSEAFSPGLEGVIATDTNLSFLDVEHERIVVRGYDLTSSRSACATPTSRSC